ncbi:hypothetical protein WJX84_002316 [Apatococcus fuscideae]|uniref:RING-type domain-containing protein n=1 Tax=Apatococcus fuscideae TaxID=2026836 RepID=A0AAW1T5A7_9CHLO
MVSDIRWVVLCGFLLVVRCSSTAEQQDLSSLQPRLSTNVSEDVGSEPLQLCDCEPARGPPNGLSCDKEGWFISSFERVGEWMGGGGAVPLSRALCCRPCLPTTLPDLPGMAYNDEPVAIVSIGCHGSTGGAALAMQCEGSGGSYVTGWSRAVQVYASFDAFYPVGPVDCCTPAVLLASGDAWELERCDCQISSDVHCGGSDTDRLLRGYGGFRITPLAELVPVAPAQCCKTCLSSRIHSMSSCADLHFCSGHGVCVLGQCECQQGWLGSDCSDMAVGAGGLPAWIISLIIIGACVFSSVLMIVTGRLVQHFTERQAATEAEEEQAAELRQSLIIPLSDDVGSVGSQDTTQYDSEEERDPSLLIHPEGTLDQSEPGQREGGVLDVEQGPSEGASGRSPDPDTVGSSGTASQGAAAAATRPAHIRPASVRSGAGSQPGSPAAAGRTSGSMPGSPRKDEDADDLLHKGEVNLATDPAALAGVTCSVCLSRPVQVVVIPCGHACMCRRCSRRLSACPVCRQGILRRQRLYIGG